MSNEAADALLRKGADKVVKTGLAGWWARRNETEKAATLLIAFAVALGPLGQGLLGAMGVLFGNNSLPSSKQVEAVIWLLVITAPLAAFVLVAGSLAGKHASVPVALGAAGLAAVVLSGAMINSAPPERLAGVYCYADINSGGVVYEEQCRAFNNAGFYAENGERAGSPSASADVFSSLVAYTVDARGFLMTLASVLACIGIVMIVREHT
jgi:hypothetical protein